MKKVLKAGVRFLIAITMGLVYIRRAAIEKGGREMNWLPECETLHCTADGLMSQTFQNGAVIVVDWADRTVTVCRKGKVVREVRCSISLEDFHNLQAWAANL